MSKIVLINEHVLLRNGLAALIKSFGSFEILFQADNGDDFIAQLNTNNLPDIVLVDIHLPYEVGIKTCCWIKANLKGVKILALSTFDKESDIIKVFKAGAQGYVLMNCQPSELKAALESIAKQGFYYNQTVTSRLIHSIENLNQPMPYLQSDHALNEREITFLRLVCNELTYREIATKMFVSPRTIDGYRDELFHKLKIRTRIGLVRYAIKNAIVNI